MPVTRWSWENRPRTTGDRNVSFGKASSANRFPSVGALQYLRRAAVRAPEKSDCRAAGRWWIGCRRHAKTSCRGKGCGSTSGPCSAARVATRSSFPDASVGSTAGPGCSAWARSTSSARMGPDGPGGAGPWTGSRFISSRGRRRLADGLSGPGCRRGGPGAGESAGTTAPMCSSSWPMSAFIVLSPA